jgi:hypothetical protein
MVDTTEDDYDDNQEVFNAHEEIPTLGDDNLLLEFPEFEEKFIPLPTLEELEEHTRKVLKDLANEGIKDHSQVGNTVCTSSNDMAVEISQNSDFRMTLHSFDSSKLKVQTSISEDQEIEDLTFEISRVLAKRK